MKTINIIKSFILTITIFSSQFANSQQVKWNKETKNFEKTNKTEINSMQAKIKTTKGDILIELEYEKTPITVANFVSLSEGTMKNSSKSEGTPYYDGLKFHRVIDNFMIQGGCPLGTGSGDPGYKFQDEFHPDLKHDTSGILSMANSGPGTNGSQFFITHNETPWLDGKHSIFGHVVEGQDVVNSIVQDDILISITIIRSGSAKDFDANKVFNNAMDEFKKEEEIRIRLAEELKKEGWDINVIQNPTGFHFCLTFYHTRDVIDDFIETMKSKISILKNNALNIKYSPCIYGTMQQINDSEIMSDVITDYLHVVNGVNMFDENELKLNNTIESGIDLCNLKDKFIESDDNL